MEEAAQQQQATNDALLARAYKVYMDAARNKDQDPDAFDAARMNYFSLKNGDSWKAQEKKRLETAKIDPAISQFRDMFQSLLSEENVQKAYTDSVATIRDQTQNMTSNLDQRSSYFSRLIDEETHKKGAYDRIVELTSQSPDPTAETPQSIPFVVRYFSSYPSSFTILLDIVLAVLVLFVLYLFLRKSRLAALSFSAMFSSFYPQPYYPAPAPAPST